MRSDWTKGLREACFALLIELIVGNWCDQQQMRLPISFYKWRYGPATFYGLVRFDGLLTRRFASRIIDELIVKAKVFGLAAPHFFFRVCISIQFVAQIYARLALQWGVRASFASG